VTGRLRQSHNKELHNFAKHNYKDEVKEDEMVRACSTNGEKRNVCRILWEIQKERDRGRIRRRWVDNIEMDLRDGMD
jgi:hypothetical protein